MTRPPLGRDRGDGRAGYRGQAGLCRLRARYGSGDEARSAPAGERLVAFKVSELDGDIGAAEHVGGTHVAVEGKSPQPVPQPETASDSR